MPGPELAPSLLIVAEPPARYTTRPPLVVDSSVICAVLFQEVEREQAEARISGHELHAPDLLDYEVGNVAVKKLRTHARADVEDGLSELASAAILSHPIDVAETVGLAERYGLSAYDAAYLWLAVALKAPLATFDRRLGEAARRHLGALDDSL